MTTQHPIALVTGGSRGLGRSTVLNLARRGINIVFTYHSNLAEAQKVRLLTPRLGRPFMPAYVDAPSPWWRAVRKATAAKPELAVASR